MPINYKKYPPNWRTEIVPRIKERDGHKCQFCGIENYTIKPNGTKVVLTIAHLDHDADNHNVADDRLAALCQACLNAYKDNNHFLELLKTVPLEHQDRVIEQEREMNFRQFLQSITIDGKIDYQKIIDNPKAFFEYLELTFNFVVKDSKNSIQLFKQEPYIKEEYKDWFNNTEGVGYYLHILALPDEKWKESLIKRPE